MLVDAFPCRIVRVERKGLESYVWEVKDEFAKNKIYKGETNLNADWLRSIKAGTLVILEVHDFGKDVDRHYEIFPVR